MEPTFGECIQKGFAGYCDYSNRSRRREYWYFALIVFLYELVINVVVGIIKVNIVTYIGYLLMAPVINKFQGIGLNQKENKVLFLLCH